MTDLKARLQKAAREVSQIDTRDMSQEAPAPEAQIWPEGVYRGRVCEVIEFGLQTQEAYEGKQKAPAEEVRLGIMLFPNAVVKKALGDSVEPLIVRPWPMAIHNSARATSKIVFDKMNVAGDAKHFREFIGDAYRFPLTVRTNSKGSKFHSIDLKGVLPAVDEDTGKPLSVPEVPDDKLTLFTFVSPLKEMWDRLKIDGTRDDGTSKNFIQEKILSARNFVGSDVDRMLKGEGAAPVVPAATSQDQLPEPPVDDEEY